MRDRKHGGSIRRWLGAGEPAADRRRARRPRLEGLEPRELLVASINPIAPLTVPADLGRVVPLVGGTEAQQFSAASDNPNIGVSVINGPFLSIDVSHASSGPGDPAFSGTMTFQLFEQLTPIAVRRILALVNQGFYTSPTQNPEADFVNLPTKNFHRVAQGFPGSQFIVQGGSVTGVGTGEIPQPGFPFRDEFLPPLVFTGQGQLAMANAGDDTNSSQFFVTTGMPRGLDFNHTIFGQLVEGTDVVQQMTQVSRDPENDRPLAPILITGTRVARANPNGSLLIDSTAAGAGEAATITVTANAPVTGSTDTETFRVDVVPNTQNQRPFLAPAFDQVTRPGEPIQFQLTGISTDPGDVLTYIVAGGVSLGSFTPVQNATAAVDAAGLVTVTPDPGFEGVIPLIVGVGDQVTTAGDPNAAAGYDTDQITLTVTTNDRPTATPIAAETDQNQPVTIQLAGDPRNPGQTLFFELASVPASGLVSNFDAQAGTVTYTPVTNFSGPDVFTYRVRDVGVPSPNLASEETTVTVQVRPGDPVPVPPVAVPQQLTVQANTPTPVQLVGRPGDPERPTPLSFTLDTTQTLGTVTDFNPETGALVYTPPPNFIGDDRLNFRVVEVGGLQQESETATVAFTIIGAVDTGAVRQVGNVLMITPPPGPLVTPPPNVVGVSLVDGRISVSVNGQIDAFRPLATELERVVVYGTKASDTITIAPDVPLLATLDGGLGGINRLQAGDLPSRLHGWFGRNTLRGGASRDELIGRMGRVRFEPSPGDDLLFAGDPNRFPQVGRKPRGQGVPPTGQFFRFVNGRLVPVDTPPSRAQGRFVPHPPAPASFAAQALPPGGQGPAAAPGLAAAVAQQRRAELLANRTGPS